MSHFVLRCSVDCQRGKTAENIHFNTVSILKLKLISCILKWKPSEIDQWTSNQLLLCPEHHVTVLLVTIILMCYHVEMRTSCPVSSELLILDQQLGKSEVILSSIKLAMNQFTR